MNSRKSVICLILFLAITPIISSCTNPPKMEDWPSWNVASQPVFPEENWKRYETPEEAGWSSEKLSSVEASSSGAGSAAVMVIYNGAILAQWGQTSRRFMCHSVRKSLLSALYGIAVGEGTVDLDETIGSIGIDDISPLSEIEKTAKVSDLLKARSGVYHPAAYETLSMKNRRPTRGSYKPGTHWYYNNWDFNTLAAIYNAKTSNDMFEAFEKQLAVPLAMQDFELRHTYYHLEPEHSHFPAYPFRMSARDLARIGLLFLNEGRWKNKQIIPSEWVHESTQPHSTYSAGGYGYMWWTFPENSVLGKLGTYAAFGFGGHAIYVVPGAKLVFVHRANTYEGKRSYIDNTFIRNTLLELLKARTGASLPAPKLVPLGNSDNIAPAKVLSKTQTSDLIGKYSWNGYVATVRELDGRLEIESPRSGKYFLFPRTTTEFETEDSQIRIEFMLDASGTATTVQVWFKKDKPYEMSRVQ